MDTVVHTHKKIQQNQYQMQKEKCLLNKRVSFSSVLFLSSKIQRSARTN